MLYLVFLWRQNLGQCNFWVIKAVCLKSKLTSLNSCTRKQRHCLLLMFLVFDIPVRLASAIFLEVEDSLQVHNRPETFKFIPFFCYAIRVWEIVDVLHCFMRRTSNYPGSMKRVFANAQEILIKSVCWKTHKMQGKIEFPQWGEQRYFSYFPDHYFL